MKKIIENKIYDTDKCDVILEYQQKIPVSTFFGIIDQYFNAKIYKTKKGTYLNFVGKCENVYFKDLNKIEVVSEEYVKNLMIEIASVDEYIKNFGQLEEG